MSIPPKTETVAVEIEDGAVAHVSPDAPKPLIDALGSLVKAAKDHFSPHARFARRLRELGNDARAERMHILADVCDEMADELESGKSSKSNRAQPDARHKYAPHKKYPWFCAHCGYAEHEVLMHFQNDQGYRSQPGADAATK